jgi:hypothetical protein
MYRFGGVHPIERLRYVARTGWAGNSMLAAEAALALGDLADHDAPAVVPACRRLLARQPRNAPLWWVSARILAAGDPVAEAERCAEMLADDPTSESVLDALPDGARVVRRGGMGEVAGADLVLVEAAALGPGGMFVDSSTARLLQCANAVESPVWVEAGTGRVLPGRIWAALTRGAEGSETGRAHRDARVVRHRELILGSVLADEEETHNVLVDLRGVEKVIGPKGAMPLDVALAECDCPEPPELLEGF